MSHNELKSEDFYIANATARRQSVSCISPFNSKQTIGEFAVNKATRKMSSRVRCPLCVSHPGLFDVCWRRRPDLHGIATPGHKTLFNKRNCHKLRKSLRTSTELFKDVTEMWTTEIPWKFEGDHDQRMATENCPIFRTLSDPFSGWHLHWWHLINRMSTRLEK